MAEIAEEAKQAENTSDVDASKKRSRERRRKSKDRKRRRKSEGDKNDRGRRRGERSRRKEDGGDSGRDRRSRRHRSEEKKVEPKGFGDGDKKFDSDKEDNVLAMPSDSKEKDMATGFFEAAEERTRKREAREGRELMKL